MTKILQTIHNNNSRPICMPTSVSMCYYTAENVALSLVFVFARDVQRRLQLRFDSVIMRWRCRHEQNCYLALGTTASNDHGRRLKMHSWCGVCHHAVALFVYEIRDASALHWLPVKHCRSPNRYTRDFRVSISTEQLIDTSTNWNDSGPPRSRPPACIHGLRAELTVTNFLERVSVKEFWKLLKILGEVMTKTRWCIFWLTVYV